MKKIALIIILFLVCPFFLFGCSSAEENDLNLYDIAISYDNENHTANCLETVTYANVSNNAFESICFHLYPNAFRSDAKTKLVTPSNIEKAFDNGESYGEIDIQSVKIGENEAEFKITGDDENILEVSLLNKLYPDEKVEICIDFVLILPNINHRFGYGENAVNFGNFYPIACVYEENVGFKKDLYSSNGDPFYSDVANYNVAITYSDKFQLASTGEQKFKTSKNGKTICQIVANKVRDFCFVLSEKFSILEEKVEDTTISYFYYEDENPTNSLKTAVDAVSTFNQMFGKYPYKTLSVVKTNFVQGGMEYPNLVMISDRVLDQTDFEYVIVHEIAHQWWYGVVGNDEYSEAWLDESLTEFSSVLFFEQNPNYGLNYEHIVENASSSYKFFLDIYSKIYDNVDTSMNRALNEFKTEPEYVNCIYTKGILMYDTIRSIVGEAKFLKALKTYYNDYSFKNARGDELVDVFEKVCGKKIKSIFKTWNEGKVVIL